MNVTSQRPLPRNTPFSSYTTAKEKRGDTVDTHYIFVILMIDKNGYRNLQLFLL